MPAARHRGRWPGRILIYCFTPLGGGGHAPAFADARRRRTFRRCAD